MWDAADGAAALKFLAGRQVAAVVTDLAMPSISGLELLEKIKAADPDCEVILLTGSASVETAVAAMKCGAYDYLTKPCSMAELEKLVEKALERRTLTRKTCD